LLDGVTLGQAASEIGRRFGVRVDVADSRLASRRVSARFRDEPLPRVLDGVSAALGARWTRDGDHVLLEEVR
jgi:ferric-dicitrate binding protein FerR (iron transport regulator)